MSWKDTYSFLCFFFCFFALSYEFIYFVRHTHSDAALHVETFSASCDDD